MQLRPALASLVWRRPVAWQRVCLSTQPAGTVSLLESVDTINIYL